MVANAEALALGQADDVIIPADMANDIFTCRYCTYRGSIRQVQCHEHRLHADISEVTRCIDTLTCAICGLHFGKVVFNRRHARESHLCKLNLLRHGPVLDDEALALSLDEDATVKTTNGKAGKTTMIKAGCCVRTFGPHRIIYDEAGRIVKASKKGHPFGGSQATLPTVSIA